MALSYYGQDKNESEYSYSDEDEEFVSSGTRGSGSNSVGRPNYQEGSLQRRNDYSSPATQQQYNSNYQAQPYQGSWSAGSTGYGYSRGGGNDQRGSNRDNTIRDAGISNGKISNNRGPVNNYNGGVHFHIAERSKIKSTNNSKNGESSSKGFDTAKNVAEVVGRFGGGVAKGFTGK